MNVHRSWEKRTDEYIQDLYYRVYEKKPDMTMEMFLERSHGEMIDVAFGDPEEDTDPDDSGTASEEVEKEEKEEEKQQTCTDKIELEGGNIVMYDMEDGSRKVMTYKKELHTQTIEKDYIKFTLDSPSRRTLQPPPEFTEPEHYAINNIIFGCTSMLKYGLNPRYLMRLFFPTDPNEFSRMLGAVYSKTNKYDPTVKSWFCYNEKEGRWMDTESDENFILMGELMGSLKMFYATTKTQANKYIASLEKKLKESQGGTMSYIRGSYTKSTKKYNKCKIKLGETEIEEGSTQVPNAVKDILPQLYRWDKIAVMSNYFRDGLSDNYEFVPRTVKASRYYFVENGFNLKLDTNPYMINFLNCTLYVRDDVKAIIPHSPDHMISKSTGYRLMHFEAVEEQIQELMKSVNNSFTCKEKTDCMLRTKAYSLVGKNPSKKFFIDYGPETNNGKGVVDTFMKKSLGEYYAPLPSEIICKGKMEFDPERPQSTLYNAIPCRYISIAEPSADAHLSGDVLKRLSGGGDSLSVRQLRKNAKTKVPLFAMYCATNHFPDFDGFDMAVVKRMVMIKWEVQFIEEKELVKETKYKKIATDIKERVTNDTTDRYASAWMYILIKNYTKDLNIHEDFLVAQEAEMKDSDYVKEYIEECLIDTEEEEKNQVHFSWITKMELYQDVKNYYFKNNYGLPPKKIFIKEFEKQLKAIEKEDRINESSYSRNVYNAILGKERSVRHFYKFYKFKSKDDMKDLMT